MDRAPSKLRAIKPLTLFCAPVRQQLRKINFSLGTLRHQNRVQRRDVVAEGSARALYAITSKKP